MRHTHRSDIFNYTAFIILLPAFFVFHSYVEFHPIIFFYHTIPLFIEYILTGVFLFSLSWLVFRSIARTAMFSLCLLAFQFFFGAIHDGLKTLFADSFLTRYSFILIVCFIVLIIISIAIIRSHRRFQTFFRYINLVLLLFLLTDGVRLMMKNNHSQNQEAGMKRTCDTCSTPDIYLIIADGYAGQTELTRAFGFDNTKFLEQLSTRGFRVVNNSRSNYSSTPYSMSSFLNMKYLSGIRGKHDDREDIKYCYTQINRNAFVKYLHAYGYLTVNNSLFTLDNIEAKRSTFALFPLQQRIISNQTFTSRLRRDLGFHLANFGPFRQSLSDAAFQILAEDKSAIEHIVKESRAPSKDPKFIYTHLMLPHYPYFFKADGSINSIEQIINFNNPDPAAYIQYLQYANRKYLSLIDQIQKNTQGKSVIMLLSDHGIREVGNKTDSSNFFYNLSAIYYPDENYSGLYDGMTNVNVLRSFLNKQFGAGLRMLKDSTILIR
jgi:hypothetical protein